MENEMLTPEEELYVLKQLAKETIERLGYEPTVRRINNMTQKYLDFELCEKRVCIG